MRILFIGNEIANHTSYGGYVHIRRFPNADFLDVASICPLFWRLGKPFKFLNYILAVRKACKLSKNYDIIHSIYEDNYYFPLFYKCRCKSVGTVHLDITGNYSPVRKFLLNRVLRKLDYIIVLSNEQKNKMTNLGYKCDFIPHGFIRPKFTPVDLGLCNVSFDASKINIFFSGNTYRDLDTLEVAISQTQDRKDVVFHVLSQKGESKHRFMRYKNVITYDRVEDNIYYTLLSKCDYNFLPLTFATANNTLLEAQFLGITSILPNLGGIMDYASKENLFYNSHAELLDILHKVQKMPLSKKISTYASRYNWGNIYKQLEKKYMEILEDEIEENVKVRKA